MDLCALADKANQLLKPSEPWEQWTARRLARRALAPVDWVPSAGPRWDAIQGLAPDFRAISGWMWGTDGLRWIDGGAVDYRGALLSADWVGADGGSLSLRRVTDAVFALTRFDPDSEADPDHLTQDRALMAQDGRTTRYRFYYQRDDKGLMRPVAQRLISVT